MMRSINPATEELVAEYPPHDERQVERRLQLAQNAFLEWRLKAFDERSAVLHRVAGVLRSRSGEWAMLMTREMGKPIASAESEVEKCAWVCDYFAEHARAMLEQQDVQSDALRSYVRFDPLGPVLAVMPWNFPFWQVFRFTAPALMAGNVAVLKHASNVCGCALAIERIFQEAGAPAGVFTTLLIDSRAAEQIIAHPLIRAVTLTGSERAGEAVGAAAGRALKKSVLELGGSDPFIVLADADVGAAAQAATKARCINSGQSCIAAKRFIVHESIADAFEAEFAASMSRQRVGNPTERNVDVGPMARDDLRRSLHEQVLASIDAGARLVAGGEPVAGRGYFYPPTVLADVRPGMPASDEETFGPVAAVIRARNVEHATMLANASKYGLGASVWTKDLPMGECIAAGLEAGNVFVNGIVKSDPRLPFGGVKRSGYGRELSVMGIREFVNVKTVWMNAEL